MKPHLILFIIILIVSCKQDVKKNSSEKLLSKEQYIQNDSLFSLLKSDLFEISFIPIFEGKEESGTLLKNKTLHDSFTHSKVFNETSIKFYRDGFSEDIIAAQIKDTRFIFLDTIHIGIKKEIFSNLIKQKLNTNSIKITNIEKTADFVFIFKNKILKEINYKKNKG